MNIKPIQQLLETEMDRKEFLMYLGASVLAVIGVSTIIRSFVPEQNQGVSQSKSKGSYNSSSYNG